MVTCKINLYLITGYIGVMITQIVLVLIIAYDLLELGISITIRILLQIPIVQVKDSQEVVVCKIRHVVRD